MAPDHGAQGNALKTLIAMPFVLDGERVCVDITAKEIKHRFILSVDALRQEPVISHKTQVVNEKDGTEIRVCWPELAKLNPARRESALFTYRRRLRLAQPAYDAFDRLVWRMAHD